MNHSPSMKKTFILSVLAIAALTIAGCASWFAAVAKVYDDDAQFAAQCASKHGPGSPQAKAAADAAQRANQARSDAAQADLLTTPDAAAARAASIKASAAAGEATDSASQIPGCNFELAKRRLDGKYNQDIFGTQKLAHGD